MQIAIPPKDRKLVCGRSIRWDDARAETAYAAGWWTHEPLGAALRRAATDAPERIVLVDGEMAVNCATLLRNALALAGAMHDRARPGDGVSMMLPNWHEAATIYFAAASAGMVIHPILPALRAHDLSRMLANAGSRMISSQASFTDTITASCCGRSARRWTIPRM